MKKPGCRVSLLEIAAAGLHSKKSVAGGTVKKAEAPDQRCAVAGGACGVAAETCGAATGTTTSTLARALTAVLPLAGSWPSVQRSDR